MLLFWFLGKLIDRCMTLARLSLGGLGSFRNRDDKSNCPRVSRFGYVGRCHGKPSLAVKKMVQTCGAGGHAVLGEQLRLNLLIRETDAIRAAGREPCGDLLLHVERKAIKRGLDA